MKSPNPPTDDVSLMSHFIELRGRFIRIFLAVLVVFLALVGFSRELYDLISNPLVALLPNESSLIATDVAFGVFSHLVSIITKSVPPCPYYFRPLLYFILV